MIKIVESEILGCPFVAVVDVEENNILSIHKGEFGDHDLRVASYHADFYMQETATIQHFDETESTVELIPKMAQ